MRQREEYSHAVPFHWSRAAEREPGSFLVEADESVWGGEDEVFCFQGAEEIISVQELNI